MATTRIARPISLRSVPWTNPARKKMQTKKTTSTSKRLRLRMAPTTSTQTPHIAAHERRRPDPRSLSAGRVQGYVRARRACNRGRAAALSRLGAQASSVRGRDSGDEPGDVRVDLLVRERPLVGGDTLRQIALFDIYRGAPLAAGEKSLAWRVVFAADERALTDEEVDADVARLISAVASAHGARLRA